MCEKEEKNINNIICYYSSIADIGSDKDYYISMDLLKACAKLFDLSIEQIEPCLILKTFFENQNEEKEIILKAGRTKKKIKYQVIEKEEKRIFAEAI